MGCNFEYVLLTPEPVWVSVPSTGRSGLQLEHAEILAVDRSCFSTLYGSKWVARLRLAGGILVLSVSVPSTGRSGLQHTRNGDGQLETTFQYPLRVEVGCN